MKDSAKIIIGTATGLSAAAVIAVVVSLSVLLTRPQQSSQNAQYKIMASLTTIPPRVGTECKRAVDSLLKQTYPIEKIYIVVSENYKRFGNLGPLPGFLYREPYKSKVEVVYYDDKGPASKYLGALNKVPQDRWLFVCDDDQEYHHTLLERMVPVLSQGPGIYQNRFSNIQIGTSGGLIHGYVGNLIHRPLLNNLPKFPFPDAARFVDDQWMSIYCFKNGISIKPTGIERYRDIYKKLTVHGTEKKGTEPLHAMGNRNTSIQALGEYFNIDFLFNGTGAIREKPRIVQELPEQENWTVAQLWSALMDHKKQQLKQMNHNKSEGF